MSHLLLDPIDARERFSHVPGGPLTRYDDDITAMIVMASARGTFQMDIASGVRLDARCRTFVPWMARLARFDIQAAWTVYDGLPVLILSHRRNLKLAKLLRS